MDNTLPTCWAWSYDTKYFISIPKDYDTNKREFVFAILSVFASRKTVSLKKLIKSSSINRKGGSSSRKAMEIDLRNVCEFSKSVFKKFSASRVNNPLAPYFLY